MFFILQKALKLYKTSSIPVNVFYLYTTFLLLIKSQLSRVVSDNTKN